MNYHEIHRMICERHKHESELAVIADVFEKLKAHHPELYDKYISRLEGIAYHITEEDATAVVKAMKPYGEKYSYDFVKNYLKEKGETDKVVDYYLAMNMAYNDYFEAARTVGVQNNNGFFFEIAKGFVNDPDAKPHKIVKYFFGED